MTQIARSSLWFAALAAAGLFIPIARAADALYDIPFPSPGSPADTQLLNLYLPSASTPSANATIIFVHGGSYNAGSRYELDPLAIPLADLGYTVVCPDYALVTPTSASYPQPITDILNCVRWVRTNGGQLNLPDTVVLGGVSAGSTIGLTAAFSASTPTFNHLSPAPGRGFEIDGVIGVMGRYDLVWNAFYGIPQTVINYIGVPFSQSTWQQTWNQASAINYITPNSPPTYLIHGTNDGLVPYYNSTRLQQRLQQAGAPVQLALVPGGGHDMGVLGPTPADQARTLAAAAAWVLSGAGAPAWGSCCAPNGFCSATSEPACAFVFSAGSACNPNPCQQPPVFGACCFPSGGCQFLDRSECSTTWNGGNSCTPNPCPQPPPPLGACCTPAGQCSVSPQVFCGAAWTVDILCNPNPCPQPMGACCTLAGACSASTQNDCSAQWLGNATCGPSSCPQPHGACCSSSGVCAPTLAAGCADTWTMFATCEPNPCALPLGTCCVSGGQCGITVQSACADIWTAQAVCEPNPCPQPPPPTGACCIGATCAVLARPDCAGPNHRFAGAGLACDATIASTTPCCRADFDQNAVVSVSDIFGYLSNWFAGSPACSISSPPASGPAVQDIFDFLSAWFSGC